MDLSTLIDIDRQVLLSVNGSESLFIDGLAKTLTTAATWIPLYLSLFYVVLKNNDSIQKIILILASAALCVILAGSLNDVIVKPFVMRWRPTHDDIIGLHVDVVNGYRGGKYGFFSSHAANTFSIAVLFALLIKSRILSITLFVWSLINCWTRLYLGVHFLGDILCGLCWGGIVGLSIGFMYLRIKKHLNYSNSYISSHYTKTGYQKSDIDIVLIIFMLTILYAIIRACCYLYI
ncbi:phosphatase PAP2 family protein [Prevotella sp. E13-17]|uniref:phosphatase PAP2 family protein n=1 Tax=Prevotella sp. E13-17 TaxID=2913616 RepID=UPI001EDB6881|nr:phosphatase PAP2 family protein [Prevotella sp. E13-17]UKK49812.1 phosphatase PAP2 family protein [Prevotella sp. E13-17]